MFGGSAGGFIGTDAYTGSMIVAATALGDEGAGTPQACEEKNPADVFIQNPAMHAFDAATGKVLWQVNGVQSFGSTTVAGGLVFNAPSLSDYVDVRLLSTGALVASLAVPAPNWGGITTAGDSILFGLGSGAYGAHTGLMCFTPGGKPPVVP